jgi:glycosyltransferase involved in cell wall biosynthesis
MKIVTWSIVNNEIDYIKNILEYHLPWIDGMYILDTGSIDGTWEVLEEYTKNNSKLIIEKYHTTYTPQYELSWEQMSNPFPEVEVRNYAIQRTKILLTPDWLLQLDGDEIFLSEVKNVILAHSNAAFISHSTLNPVCDTSTHRVEHRFGMKLYDPHSRVWNCKYNIEYIKNKSIKDKEYHCIPSIKGWNRHLFESPGNVWVKDNFHFHLHWLYGRKMEMFLKQTSPFSTREDILKNYPINEFGNLLPQIFIKNREIWKGSANI